VSVRSFLQRTFHRSGGVALLRLRNAKRNRVLTYHRFQNAAAHSFDEQCAHLENFYTPVNLDDVVAFLRDGKTLASNSVAITVDDGYRDFYIRAYPSLKRHGIQATVFLMTDFVDRRTWPWWDQLHYAFLHTPLPSPVLQIADGVVLEYALLDAASRIEAGERTAEAMKSVPNARRLELIARLPELLQVNIPRDAPPPSEPLSWDEVREMASHGIGFGAHTKSHPILSSLESDQQIRDEIEGSRDRIADELGRPPMHFSYPNGRRQDIGERIRTMVERAGFQTAVSTESGFNDRATDPYFLRRISMEPSVPGLYFRQQVAGFRV